MTAVSVWLNAAAIGVGMGGGLYLAIIYAVSSGIIIARLFVQLTVVADDCCTCCYL